MLDAPTDRREQPKHRGIGTHTWHSMLPEKPDMDSILASTKRIIPPQLKGLLIRAYRAVLRSPIYRAVRHKPLDRHSLLQYWQSPWDGRNTPESYLEGKERSELLLNLIRQHADTDATLLEIGCNVGRNLYYLFSAGFTKLTGIELSGEALRLLKAAFPEMAQHIRTYNAAAEDVLPRMDTDSFDVVFTMAVLEHIHSDSEWLFREIVRVTKKILITIEDEEHISWRHFPRNYRRVFQSLGLEQIDEKDCTDIPGLGPGFVARVFRKR